VAVLALHEARVEPAVEPVEQGCVEQHIACERPGPRRARRALGTREQRRRPVGRIVLEAREHRARHDIGAVDLLRAQERREPACGRLFVVVEECDQRRDVARAGERAVARGRDAADRLGEHLDRQA